MRFASLSILCFLACTVLAAPLPGGSTKGAPAAPPPKGKPAGTAVKPGNKAPTKRVCGGKKKRSNTPVKDAWLAKGPSLGHGQKGTVYDLPKGFGGQPAVIKEIQAPWDTNAKKEAQNLAGVHQLLGWGITDDIPKKDAHEDDGHRKTAAAYIIMKKMGVTREAAGLSAAAAIPLEEAARARYKKDFGMTNKDAATPNSPNFLFHKVGATWVAEIIDWDRADPNSSASAGTAEVIDWYCVPGAFP